MQRSAGEYQVIAGKNVKDHQIILVAKQRATIISSKTLK